MIRLGLAFSSALACALGCASCSAPTTCDAQPNPYDAQLIESEDFTGSLLLSEARESQALLFRAKLSDLPELWSSHGTVQDGVLSLELSLRYAREPFGGDGQTEMPRLAVTFSKPASAPSTSSETSKFPGPAPLTLAPNLFEDCAFESRQCETTLAVRIDRQDGAPFPPLSVAWHAVARARIGACRALSTDTRASLEVEDEAP